MYKFRRLYFLFWFATQLIVGGILSITVTVNPQVVVLPEPSVTVQTTEVAPRVTDGSGIPLPAD